MFKKLTITALGVMVALGSAVASPISPDEALARVRANGPAKAAALNASTLKLAHTAKTEKGIAAAYIFTPAEGNGFTILSADDMAVPVLGYSVNESIDVNNLPPALEWWLEKQAERIEYAVSNGWNASPRIYAAADMTPIEPLVKTKWDQGAPYNDYCPKSGGKPTYTGCVATAFAQVMNYFKYPEVGQGSITYASSNGRLTMNFARTMFEWDYMLDDYSFTKYTDDQADAVATLMKACGYSVEMMYGTQASGTQSYKLMKAAVEYFNYDKATYYTVRDYYTLDEWSRLIYDNLKNVGPVLYDGMALEGGHSFVCDGYDGNGYFHFNWGWSGMSDGYYVLDALNPDSQGIGGSEGGFNFDQGVVLAMQPPTGPDSHYPYSNIRVYGNVVVKSLEGNTLKFTTKDINWMGVTGWSTASYIDGTVNVGAIITRVDGTGEAIDVAGTITDSAGKTYSSLSVYGAYTYYFPGDNNFPTVTIPSLPDGEYKVTVAAQDAKQADAPWQPIRCTVGNINFCYLTVKDGKLSVSNASPVSLKFNNAEFQSPLYFNYSAKLVTEIQNDSDLQLTGCYYPVLYKNGQQQYIGDYFSVSVDPQSTVSKENYVNFYQLNTATYTGPGTYQLVLIDRDTYEILGRFGEYEYANVSSTLSLKVNDFYVEGAVKETVTSGSEKFEDTYVINDASSINVIFDYTVNSGFFINQFKMRGTMYNYQNGNYEPFPEDLYSCLPYVGQGQTSEIEVTLPSSIFKNGYVYSILAGYLDNRGSLKNLGEITLKLNNSGVDGIEMDEADQKVEYYNLQGQRITNPQPGQILIRRTGSSTSKIIY